MKWINQIQCQGQSYNPWRSTNIPGHAPYASETGDRHMSNVPLSLNSKVTTVKKISNFSNHHLVKCMVVGKENQYFD